jgi:hypothetical protein
MTASFQILSHLNLSCHPSLRRDETQYITATEPNRLMLFGETVAVYCENHTEHTDTVRTSQETLLLHYRAQPVNAVW